MMHFNAKTEEKCSEPALNVEPSHIHFFLGPLLSEVHQVFSDWSSQIIRHYYDEPEVVEFEWLVGPIPVQDGNGKEVVTKYRTNLNTDGSFVTDTSGRNNLGRKRDARPTWDLEVHEPVAGKLDKGSSRENIPHHAEMLQYLHLMLCEIR